MCKKTNKADAQYDIFYGRFVANSSKGKAFIRTVLFGKDFLLPLKSPSSLYHRVEESHLETKDVLLVLSVKLCIFVSMYNITHDMIDVSPRPQPAAAPVAPAPAGPGASGCPGTPPASGTSGRTGSGNLSSTHQSPSPLTEHTAHH